jgi:glycerol-3-phosphate acyltransferase PlsY
MLPLGIIVVLSYLVGSIPTSIILSKLSHGIDIRHHGSGNAGGTNVARTLGWKAGALVVALDILKGYAATMLVTKLMYGPIPFNNNTPFEDFTVIQIVAGCAAILGHIFTAFGGFRGGKGIATALGALVGVATVELLISVAVFILVFYISRYVSLGSIAAAVTFPLSMFFRHNIFHGELQGYNTLIFFSIGIALLLVYTHRENIKRLLAGTEHRLTGSHLAGSYKRPGSSSPGA